MITKQIRSNDGTGTLSYLIIDELNKISVIIDPNLEDLQKIIYLIDESGSDLTYIIDTHTHADHISAAGELKKFYGTKLLMHSKTKDKWKIADQGDSFGIGDILRKNAALEVDVFVNDGDILKTGSLVINVIYTPGHTDNHIALLINKKLFTGDLLLIGQAGRSDLPGGNPAEQYDSLFDKVLPLPEDTEIYPGHDYEDNSFSLLKNEISNNPFLMTRSKNEYIEFVKDFFPPAAETAENGKMTLQCGTKRVINNNVPFKNLNAPELARMLKADPDLYLLDVREPFELLAYGKIPGVVNIPMGQVPSRLNELPDNKNTPVVVICQSGNRSLEISYFLSKNGFSNIYNLEGGTSGWIYSSDPEVKSYS